VNGTAAGEKKRVLLISSRHVGWVGIRHVLQNESFWIVADTSQVEAGLRLAEEHQPHLILITTDLSGVSIAEIAVRLLAVSPESTLVLCGDDIGQDVPELGVSGHLPWQLIREDSLPVGLEAALNGFWVGSGGLIQTLVGQGGKGAEKELIALTPAERSVLDGLLLDQKEKEIAEAEGVAERTIRHRAGKLKRKYGVQTLWGLTKVAWERGYRPGASNLARRTTLLPPE